MHRLIGFSLVATLAAVTVGSLLAASPALAVGPQTADLGDGGRVRGDISSTEGEVDRIGLDLVEGGTLTVKFVPDFDSGFELLDPEGNPFPLPARKGLKTIAKNLPVERTGHYEFRITAVGGAQGGYRLTAKPGWTSKLTFDGQSGDSVDLLMPAGTRVKGKISEVGSPGYVPRIDGLVGPSGDLLPAPLDGRSGKVALPWLTAESSGTHTLTVGASEGSGAFRAVLKRKVPKSKATSLDLTNGINQVSFANDGVAAVFENRCASCHTHDHSSLTAYPGARARATLALGKIRNGSMPPGGAGIPADEVALIAQWIKTGRAR